MARDASPFGTPTFPAVVPAVRWSQRRHLLCLRFDVPNAFDVQACLASWNNNGDTTMLVISCYGDVIAPRQGDGAPSSDAGSKAPIFYQFRFIPHGPIASDALDTCRTPTAVTGQYFRVEVPKGASGGNWSCLGRIIPNDVPQVVELEDGDDDDMLVDATHLGGGCFSSARVVYDWDHCEGHLRSRFGDDADDDGVGVSMEDAEIPRTTEAVTSTMYQPPTSKVGESVADGTYHSAAISRSKQEKHARKPTEEMPTEEIRPRDEEESTSEVSSLDSEEIEEDFANGLMEQLADEQGMQLTPEFYQSYITRKITAKKKRRYDKLMRDLLKGKQCNCEERAVLEKVVEFANEMDGAPDDFWVEAADGENNGGGDVDSDLQKASRVYHEIITASKKTANSRAALATLAAAEQRKVAPLEHNVGENSHRTARDAHCVKDPQTVEEALALLFPVARWKRMVRKNGIVKSFTYTSLSITRWVVSVLRWSLGWGALESEAPLLEDAVFLCLLGASMVGLTSMMLA